MVLLTLLLCLLSWMDNPSSQLSQPTPEPGWHTVLSSAKVTLKRLNLTLSGAVPEKPHGSSEAVIGE
jgi:hypothetical protein